jgi:hypothetical protein
VQELRAEHPAWIGEHGLGAAPAMKALTDACTSLPSTLRDRLEMLVVVSADERATRLARGVPPLSEDYLALRGRVCADQSVFDDSARMQPHERGPAIIRRCRLEEAGLGDATDDVLGHLSIAGFVLHRFLLDDGIDPELARDAVMLWVYPDFGRTVTLPRLGAVAPMQDTIFVRLDANAVELPGGRTLPLSGSHVADARAFETWVRTEMEKAFPDEERRELVVEAGAEVPALGLLAIIAADNERPVGVLGRLEGGDVGVEYVSKLPDDRFPSHVLTATAGGYRLTFANGETILPAADLDALDRWAAALADPKSIVLAIDVRSLTVQQLVDVQQTLRGRDCDLLSLNMDGEGEHCRLFSLTITTP